MNHLGQAGVLVHGKAKDVGVAVVLWIPVELLLMRLHSESPLVKLRDGDIPGLAYQQHHLLAVEITLAIDVAGVVSQVIVVGEEYPWDIAVSAVQIVESDEGRRR